jgi:predicted RNA binding protein YcfA (HicA-like mRNA interferase family)
MPNIRPIKRRDLIRFLKKLGFEGPLTGGKHQFMLKGEIKLRIPNPHAQDISIDLLIRILRQGGVSKEDWEKV